jgi:hypothetical protein
MLPAAAPPRKTAFRFSEDLSAVALAQADWKGAFPRLGKSRGKFSRPWKISRAFFQGLENSSLRWGGFSEAAAKQPTPSPKIAHQPLMPLFWRPKKCHQPLIPEFSLRKRPPQAQFLIEIQLVASKTSTSVPL